MQNEGRLAIFVHPFFVIFIIGIHRKHSNPFTVCSTSFIVY